MQVLKYLAAVVVMITVAFGACGCGGPNPEPIPLDEQFERDAQDNQSESSDIAEPPP